jgi:hypothetical protein
MTGCHVPPNQQWNLIWGYYAHWVQILDKTAAAASEDIYSTAVPADECWFLQCATIANNTRAATVLLINLNDGTNEATVLARGASYAQYVPLAWTGQAAMGPGTKVRLRHTGATVGDSIGASVWGYKMKLTQ